MYYNKYLPTSTARHKSAAKHTTKSLISQHDKQNSAYYQPAETPSNAQTLIKNELSMCIQKSCPPGIISLDDFQYEAYNNDFGPLTVHDLVSLTQMLSRKHAHTTVHIGNNYKLQARGVCLLACYLMHSKKFSV